MLKTIFITGIITLILAILYLYTHQRNFIYFPSKETPDPKDYQAQDMQDLNLTTQDGLHIKAWYKPATVNKPTILYLHGTGGNRGERMFLGRSFIDAGLGLLLIDYRGYAENPGSPSEEGLYQDGEAAFQFLLSQGVSSENIILYGESLGSGVATWLATQHKTCAVILQSAYTSMQDLSHYYYPWLFVKPWDKFDSISRIQAIQAPLLVLHGNQDKTVPYSQGLALFEKALEPKKMVTFDHAGHNHIWHSADFVPAVTNFVDALSCKK